MMGRIVRPTDFQRVLGTSPWARSRHFAVHHLQQAPGRSQGPASRVDKLSTDPEQTCPQLVDESPGGSPAEQPLSGWWLGLVVPKRHARRSVTRSLLKRQMRAVANAAVPPAQPALRPGMWVLRLRSVIDRKLYPSASSEALRRAMFDELQQLIGQALRRCHD